MTEAEQSALREWTSTAFDEVVAAGYVCPPWRPSPGACEQMRGYYISGLSPAEAAQAMFATRH